MPEMPPPMTMASKSVIFDTGRSCATVCRLVITCSLRSCFLGRTGCYSGRLGILPWIGIAAKRRSLAVLRHGPEMVGAIARQLRDEPELPVQIGLFRRIGDIRSFVGAAVAIDRGRRQVRFACLKRVAGGSPCGG